MQIKTIAGIGVAVLAAGGVIIAGLGKSDRLPQAAPQVNRYTATATGAKIRIVGQGQNTECAVIVELPGDPHRINPTPELKQCKFDSYQAENPCKEDCIFDLLAHSEECCKALRAHPGYIASTLKELIAHPKGKRVLVVDGKCDGKDTLKGLPTTYTCSVPLGDPRAIGSEPRFPHAWLGREDLFVGGKEATLADEVQK